MAGKGTLSANQTSQYGDKKQLQKMSSLTKTPMTGVPTQRKGAGRPVSTGAGSQRAATPQAGVPGADKGKMAEFAKAVKLLNYWQAVDAAAPNEETKMNLMDAQEHVEKVAEKLRKTTPFW